MKDSLGFPFILAYSFHLPHVPPLLSLCLGYAQQKHKLLKGSRTKSRINSPSERWHCDVLFIFHRYGKLGGLALFFLGGEENLFDMSRVDFLSFPIYWQNEERRNIGFGNKEPIMLKKMIIYIF